MKLWDLQENGQLREVFGEVTPTQKNKFHIFFSHMPFVGLNFHMGTCV